MGRENVLVLALAALLLASALVAVGGSQPAAVRATGPDAGLPRPTPVSPAAGSPVEVAPGFSPGPGVRDLGPVTSATGFDVAVGLSPQNASGLASYLTALYAPGSSVYHHFLPAPMLSQMFGASAQTTREAVAYFESFGLTATLSPDHLLVTVRGPASRIGPAFDTSFDAFGTASGTQFISHSAPAVLPGRIAWSGAYGLGNATPLSPAASPLTDQVPVAGPDATCTGSGVLVPCQVWQAYDLGGTIANGTDGNGETIGIVDAYDAAEPQAQLASDLVGFDSRFDLASPTVNYLYPVPSDHDLNTTDTQWGDEEALDLEWNHAIAPGASIDMTFSPNPGAGLYEDVDYLVSHQLVNVISMSWGEPDVGVYNTYLGPCASACNASTDGSYDVLSPVLEFAAAEGISVFAASGDCGAADGTSGFTTNFPASDPFVTGVGGTNLGVSANGTWESEEGWNGTRSGATAPGCQNQGGSGGGTSPFPRPWWQTGTGLPAAGQFRSVPDVSAVAVPGVEVVLDGSVVGLAGTSLSTPVWAGIATDADQNAHESLGFLNPVLYGILREPGPAYANDFHDIVVGNNHYSAGIGWDAVTGIGSPIVGPLLSQLSQTVEGISDLRVDMSASATSGTAPLSVTFSVTASDGSGSYPIEGVYFGDNTSDFAPGGVVEHDYTATGVYLAQAYVIDSSGNISTSVPLAVVVGGGSALSVELSPSTSSPAAGAAVTFTTTTTGGIAPYSFWYTFGDGTFQPWTPASSVSHTYEVTGSFCAGVIAVDSGVPPDGGSSLPVALAVGSSPAPECGETGSPLVVATNSSEGVRDAPAQFPDLFQVSGGAGTITEQYRSTDPYVAACGCEIFRGPGNESVWLYANDSVGQSIVAETNLTVVAALDGVFTASPTYGPAPLRVNFNASFDGGTGAGGTVATWTFGDGNSATGAAASETYTVPGVYWAVGHLSDRGDGNASEAFLIDVGAEANYVTATIDPAEDVPSGATVDFSANGWTSMGAPEPATFAWSLAGEVLGYTPTVNRTFYAPSEDAGSYAPSGNVSVFFDEGGATVSAPYRLASFFAVESNAFVPAVDALVVSDSAGPATGPPPVSWEGNATGDGPGGPSFDWSFGDGTVATGPTVVHSYALLGEFTTTLRVADPWGDVAVDAHGVNVTYGAGSPLELVYHLSAVRGPAPLTVTFTASLSGGSGGPYSYLWQFGDGFDATSGNSSHTYDRTGAFEANLTAWDSAGVSAVETVEITVYAAAPNPPSLLGDLSGAVPLAVLALAVGVGVGALLSAAARRSRAAGPPAPTP